MKMIFVVYQIEDENGKYYAFADTIKTGQNLRNFIGKFRGEKVCHLCESRKQADELAIAWNETFKENGAYAFAKTA